MFLIFNEIKCQKRKARSLFPQKLAIFLIYDLIIYYERENHSLKVVRKVVESLCDKVARKTIM